MTVIASLVDWGSIDEALAGEQLDGESLLAAGAVLVVGFFVAWLIGRWRRQRLARYKDHTRQLVGLTLRVSQVLVLAVSVGWALTTLGADIGWLTVVLLAFGVIAVLALRPIIEGMGASAALVTRPAFSVGDEIAVDDLVGEVLEITNRSTVLRLRDARRVHIPNVNMLSKTVTVYTVDQLRRSDVDVAIGFGNDIDHVEEVLRAALSELDTIERVGSMRARSIGLGVQLSVRFWHPSSIQEGNEAIDDAVRTIVATLEREGIPFAPPLDVVIRGDSDSGSPSDANQ
ncbi:MAG: mechanosensitive ion channel family protein [Acidimicrobiales bacterium]